MKINSNIIQKSFDLNLDKQVQMSYSELLNDKKPKKFKLSRNDR